MKLSVPIYGQRDYTNLYLGNSGLKVSDYGCTSVCCASALGFKPEDFIGKMNSTNGYTSDGLLIWQKAADTRATSYTGKYWNTIPADLIWIKDQIKAGKPVLLETRFPGNYSDSQRDNISHQHWVICISEDLIVNDPWFKDEVFFQGRYGDPTRWIYSAFVFDYKINQNTVNVDKATFENLVNKSTKYDQFVSAGFNTADDAKKAIQKLIDEKNAIDHDKQVLSDKLAKSKNLAGQIVAI